MGTDPIHAPNRSHKPKFVNKKYHPRRVGVFESGESGVFESKRQTQTHAATAHRLPCSGFP